MNDKETRIQEIVTSRNEVTNHLSKEFVRLKKIALEDREKIVGELKKRGVLDDILAYLKKEADEGDQFSLNLFNLWKSGRLPE